MKYYISIYTVYFYANIEIFYQIAFKLLLEEVCWLYLGSICLEFCLNTGSTLFPALWAKLYVIFLILLFPVKLAGSVECWGG